jgi:hypothetical protein
MGTGDVYVTVAGQPYRVAPCGTIYAWDDVASTWSYMSAQAHGARRLATVARRAAVEGQS